MSLTDVVKPEAVCTQIFGIKWLVGLIQYTHKNMCKLYAVKDEDF